MFEELCRAQKVDDATLNDLLETVYNLLEPELQLVAKSYQGFLNGLIKKKDRKRSRVILSIKPLHSLQSKVIERCKPLSEVKDLVRATILLSHEDDVKKLYHDIVRKKSEVIRHAKKEKGGDSLFGYYGSFHIIFYYRGLNVELQLMTKKLWSYKDALHELYEKYREEESPNMDKFEAHTCRMLFSKGNHPKLHYKRSEVRQNYKQLARCFKG